MKLTGHGRVISVLFVLVAFAIVLGLVIAALTIWPSRRASPPPQGPPLVAASIHPLADLCTQVGGAAVQVVTLLPAGADPHTYEMTTRDARALAGAQLIVQVGGGLDPFASRLAAAASSERSVRTFEAMAAVPVPSLLSHDEAHAPPRGGAGGMDPHVWLDPVLVRDCIVPALEGQFAAMWPEHAAAFAANAAGLRERLTALDSWIYEQVPEIRAKGLITVHPAWGYFGRRYGIDVWAVEQHAGTEPSPLWLAQLIEIGRFRGIGTLFIEPRLSAQAAAALQRELQVQVMVLDPIGGPERPGYRTYVELMRTNVETMMRGLR